MELIHWGRQADTGQVNRMGAVLSGLIESSSQMDVLTGYFYFNGVPELAEALKKKAGEGKPFTLRILVGIEAQRGTRAFAREIIEREPPANLTEAQRKVRYAENLLDILKSTPGAEKMNADKRLYDRFVTMLTDETLKLEIKQTKQPNHGKLYLFHPEDPAQPKTYVLGSSNFSRQGLKERHELNLRVERDPERAKELADLFEELWKYGSDDIIEVSKKKGSPEETPEETPKAVTPDDLVNVSPYARPTPFEAYMALMKHYLGNSVLADDVKRSFENAIESAGYNKVQYQLKGAAQATGIIEQHGGVIIADAVGLGKSVTAALIATQAHPGGGVIIVPPTLVDEWKTEYLEKFKLNAPGRPWAVFSMTELTAAQAFCNNNATGMVIVDEAHRFRNPKHRDYPALKNLCNGRRVVLLTATPFNNAPSDLAALIDLFEARAEKISGSASTTAYDHIIEQDKLYKDLVFLQRNMKRPKRPPTVEKSYKDLEKKHSTFKNKADISEALKKIGEDLLDKLRPYIIRRNRADLKVNPDFFQEDGKPMRMPKQTVRGKYYALSAAQRIAYLAVLEVFRFSADTPAEEDRDAGRGESKGFACTIYRVGEFVEVDEKLGNYLDNYRSMTLRHLLRRFESSPYAFKRSVEDLIQRHEGALEDLMDAKKLCFNPKGIDFGGNDNDDEDEDAASDFIDTIICRPGSPVKGKLFKDGKDLAFIAGLEADLIVLNEMLEHANVLLRDDSKLALLKEIITPSVNQKQGGRDPLLEPGEALPTLDNLPDGAPRRVVIFSMFIDTARHLAQELSRTYGKDMVMLAVDKPSGTQAPLDLDGVRIVHSATEVKACFDVKAHNDNLWTAPRILITTDKFSEGVNLNRAGLLVNYDIPWNPVRVIQRLGRINRINACWFEKIHVFNLYPEYTRSDKQSGTAPGWASPQEIAAQKLILIHNLFFEDATILGDEGAGGERPFDTVDKGAEADSEPTSEETQIRIRYQAGLEKRSNLAESVATFEERLLAYGTGMKTVRLGRPEANMLIFKQNGAQIKAEVLDDLHTTDPDKRTQSIKLLDALGKVASAPDDPCPEPDRFPDAYEVIEKHMGTPPSRIEGTTQSGGRDSPLDKALDVVDAWKKRADLQDLLLDLADVYDACEQRGLTENLISQISKAGSPANREQVEAIMKAASTATKSYASSTMTATQVAPQEPILTFVNEITENA